MGRTSNIFLFLIGLALVGLIFLFFLMGLALDFFFFFWFFLWFFTWFRQLLR
jgi:hypothetical protein